MDDRLVLKVKDDEFISAISQLRDANINIHKIVREYLINYLVEEDAA